VRASPRKGGAFDVASNKLLALFVMEGVTQPEAEASVILRGDLRYIIVSDKLLLMQLCEYPFSDGLLD
jgi:hypothetical protein